MRARSGPTLEHRVVATRLRLLRERAGLSQRDAADALGSHTATVRRIERAETGLDAYHIHTLLTRYGATEEEQRHIMADLAAASMPGWWHPWRSVMEPWQQELIGVESAANLIRMWHPGLVPELLRTPAYAAGALRALDPGLSAPEVDRRTELLQRHRERLAEHGAVLWALLPEAVLHTAVGEPSVMEEQLSSLQDGARAGRVILQIVPLAAPPHRLTGTAPIRLIRVPVPEIPDHLVREGRHDATEVYDDPGTVGEYRIRMDEACAAAPRPTTTVRLTPTGGSPS